MSSAISCIGVPQFVTQRASIQPLSKNVLRTTQRKRVSRKSAGKQLLTISRTQPEKNTGLNDHFPPEEGLPLSMYSRFEQLPPDGKLQTEQEETCDPFTQRCQTPTFVYESKCRACTGTGMIASGSSRRGRHTLYTCMHCHGLGYVRRTTTRFIPPLNGDENGDVLTLGRNVDRPYQNGHLNGNGHVRGKFQINEKYLKHRKADPPESSQNGKPKN
eukprot:TRINITY_DN2269_c0_g1_i1.p2 TRINITY_DN2269_c0_g1~~TRINITY_DN2269_c0_g1_i1.p2  ORF type:complete len:216 (+),score=5.28 TRINITY_DN2269_c0_g1_i1:148-795(+)